MHQGLPLSIELAKVESQLLDNALKYHYLVADERVRNRRPSRLTAVRQSLRALVTPRPEMREERI